MILRFRQINKDTFEAIRDGRKKIETRAATEKYKNIEIDEKIKFVCGGESFIRAVKKVYLFKTITALLKKFRVEQINPNIRSKKELRIMYESFPGYKEKIKKFGLTAIELK